MRIRVPFTISFLGLCVVASYLGFSQIKAPVNDKFLHFFTFFILTICFYWILDSTRRRVFNFTLGVCTLLCGVGSEFVQHLVNPNREFDSLDILSNLIGSGSGLLLCTWYHRRMLERKRLAKSYQPVAPDDVEFDQEAQELEDIEAGPSNASIPSEVGMEDSKH